MIKGRSLLDPKEKMWVFLDKKTIARRIFHYEHFIKQAWVALLCVGRGILAINILCIKKLHLYQKADGTIMIPKGLFSRTISTRIVLRNVWYAQTESLGTFPPA